MKLGIRAKLFLLSLGLILVPVFVSYAYLRGALEESTLASVRSDLRVRARLVAHELGDSTARSPDQWQAMGQNTGQRAG